MKVQTNALAVATSCSHTVCAFNTNTAIVNRLAQGKVCTQPLLGASVDTCMARGTSVTARLERTLAKQHSWMECHKTLKLCPPPVGKNRALADAHQ